MPTKKSAHPKWDETVGAFARAVRVDLTLINKALESEVGEPSDDALELLLNPVAVPDNQLRKALESANILPALLNLNFAMLRPVVETASATPKATFTASVLPDIQPQESFIETIEQTAKFNFGNDTLQGAIQIFFAHDAKFFKIPADLEKMLLVFSETLEEAVPDEWYTAYDLVTSQKYGDLKVPGGARKYVTTEARNEFFTSINSIFWKAMYEFNVPLLAWKETYRDSLIEDNLMSLGGGASNQLSVTPDIGPLRAAAKSFAKKMNKLFKGTRIVTVRALTIEAENIQKLLKNKDLPTLVGAGNRQQMMQRLDIDVADDLKVIQNACIQYALGVLHLENIKPHEELMYVRDMIQIERSIPWANYVEGNHSSAGNSGYGLGDKNLYSTRKITHL